MKETLAGDQNVYPRLGFCQTSFFIARECASVPINAITIPFAAEKKPCEPLSHICVRGGAPFRFGGEGSYSVLGSVVVSARRRVFRVGSGRFFDRGSRQVFGVKRGLGSWYGVVERN